MRSALTLLLAVSLLFTGAACGNGDDGPAAPTPPPGWPSEKERTLRPGDAPTPFTAAQLREHCPSGLHIRQISEAPGREPKRSLTMFEESTEEGTTISYIEVGGKRGGMHPSQSERLSWVALQSQMSSKADATTITEETITTQLGTFKCMVYTVTREVQKKQADTRMLQDPEQRGGPQSEVVEDKMWYAYDLPGPPVRWVKTADGEVIFAMTQYERTRASPESGK